MKTLAPTLKGIPFQEEGAFLTRMNSVFCSQPFGIANIHAPRTNPKFARPYRAAPTRGQPAGACFSLIVDACSKAASSSARAAFTLSLAPPVSGSRR